MPNHHDFFNGKLFNLILAVSLLQGSLYFGFSLESVQVVVVREADLRFGPVPLPLTQETRNRLLRYIKSGGDIMHTDPAPYYNEHETSYTQLLDFLSSKDKISVGDLFTNTRGIYSIKPNADRWFKGPVVSNIIDATQKRPARQKSTGPLAISDGNLWWIFYRGHKDQIGLLLVTAPVNGQITPLPE